MLPRTHKAWWHLQTETADSGKLDQTLCYTVCSSAGREEGIQSVKKGMKGGTELNEAHGEGVLNRKQTGQPRNASEQGSDGR